MRQSSPSQTAPTTPNTARLARGRSTNRRQFSKKQLQHWFFQPFLFSTLGFCCVTGGWLMIDAIAPPLVQAYVSRTDVTLPIYPNEPYATFLSRAEAVARAATQRSFDRDILVSEVYIVVVGQKPGASVQVLSLQVSREQWRRRPDSRRWATYFSSTKSLLGFGQPTSNQPSASPDPRDDTPATPTVIQSPIVTPVPASIPDAAENVVPNPAVPSLETEPPSSFPTAPTLESAPTPGDALPTIPPSISPNNANPSETTTPLPPPR